MRLIVVQLSEMEREETFVVGSGYRGDAKDRGGERVGKSEKYEGGEGKETENTRG